MEAVQAVRSRWYWVNGILPPRLARYPLTSCHKIQRERAVSPARKSSITPKETGK